MKISKTQLNRRWLNVGIKISSKYRRKIYLEIKIHEWLKYQKIQRNERK